MDEHIYCGGYLASPLFYWWTSLRGLFLLENLFLAKGKGEKNMFSNTKRLTTIAVLAALAVVLRMLTIYLTAYSRLVFHNIPIMIGSLMFGPIWGLGLALISDVSAMPYTNGWSPIFMIPQLFWGLMPGLLMKVFKKNTIKGLFMIELITHIFVSVANTIVLAQLISPRAAYGTITTTFRFGFDFIGNTYAVNFGTIDVPTRLILVVLLMCVKVPIDVYILKTVQDRVVEPLSLNMT